MTADQAEQLEGYEERWNRRLTKVQTLAEGGETSLARVVAVIEHGDREALDAEEESFWQGQVVSANPVVMAAQRRAVVNAVLLRLATLDTACVVELGSGDGLNLASLWLNGGPADARYLALEPARTGRRCAEALGELEPRYHLEAHHYDYLAPAYEMIPDGLERLLVFTHGSVEQIQTLPESVVTQLLDKAEHVACAHFEPIGWQVQRRLDRRGRAHRARCERLGYNENLWPLLRELEADGRIAVDRVDVNRFGRLNHPTTIVVWHKRAAG